MHSSLKISPFKKIKIKICTQLNKILMLGRLVMKDIYIECVRFKFKFNSFIVNQIEKSIAKSTFILGLLHYAFGYDR